MRRSVRHHAPRASALALFVTLVAGCGEVSPPPRAACAPAPQGLVGSGREVAFIDDDFARAREAARADGRLLFVDGWAPWCHTCLSMRKEVLSRGELASMQRHYVFAALDTDRDENAEFLGRFPMKGWPTFFVIDPVDLRIVELHAGSMSLPEMQRFLALGLEGRAPHGPFARHEDELSRAHALFAAKDFAGAAALYEAASGEAWPRRNEALLGTMRALSAGKRDEACWKFGLAHLREPTGTSPPADFLYYLRECAESAPAGDREAVSKVALERARELASHPPEGSSVDDRADLLDMLSEAEAQAGHADLAKRAQEDRLALLEAAAKATASPEEARVFDYQRMGAYLALGRGDEAVAMFRARVKELPESYEAWARLASTLHTLHRDVEAKPAVEEAITRSYGPRRLRYLALRAEIQGALGDLDGAVRTLEEEVHGHEGLKAGQADQEKLSSAKKRLATAVAARDEAVAASTTPLGTSRTTPSR